MNKNIFRTLAKENRKNISHKFEKSISISQILLNIEKFQTAHTIFSYLSLPNEVSTHHIHEHILQNEQSLYLPKVDISTKTMAFHHIQNIQDDCVLGTYGIYEPTNNCPACSSCDVILVPLLAGSYQMQRMGYGAGYYDRFLAESPCYKIGLAFSEQIYTEIPVDSHDILLDCIVTEEKILFSDSCFVYS